MFMKKNMGTIDRAARILLAAVVAALYFTGQISGLVATILGIFAVIFIVTSFIGVCPLYRLVGLSTKSQ